MHAHGLRHTHAADARAALGRRVASSAGVKVRAIIKLIEGDGWQQMATRGSHRQYRHPTKPGKVTVAGKPSRDLPLGLEASILRQAGLKR